MGDVKPHHVIMYEVGIFYYRNSYKHSESKEDARKGSKKLADKHTQKRIKKGKLFYL
jgi:hypothetical protein